MSGDAGAGHAPPYAAAIRVKSRGRELTGSGVLVGSRHVLTCAHVLADIDAHNASKPLRTSFDEDVPSGWISNTGSTQTQVAVGLDRFQEGNWQNARYVDEDTKYDLALLELDRPVYGVMPPLIGVLPKTAGKWIAFGHQNGMMMHSDLTIAASAVHRERDEGPALAISFDVGLPGGYSGGPLIALDQRGRHWLAGISALGGMISPVGMAAREGPVLALLEKALGPQPQDLDRHDPTVPAGVAAAFSCPAGEALTIEFRWTGQHFRAVRPLSANAWRRLQGQPDRIGGDRLPADLPDGAAVKQCLGRLEVLAGVRLRLPKAEELNIRAAIDDALPFFGGNLALLGHYDALPDMSAPLPGTAEWTQDGGEIRCLSRRPGRDAFRPLEAMSRKSEGSPHLRQVLRPVFGPGS